MKNRSKVAVLGLGALAMAAPALADPREAMSIGATARIRRNGARRLMSSISSQS